mmetsp:Transcript_22647/g.52850  ORF Transcript_22647/g.52850 Transcript_22647/m.52850 type:complete len:150 (-) Transcript_22647:45-494(-)
MFIQWKHFGHIAIVILVWDTAVCLGGDVGLRGTEQSALQKAWEEGHKAGLREVGLQADVYATGIKDGAIVDEPCSDIDRAKMLILEEAVQQARPRRPRARQKTKRSRELRSTVHPPAEVRVVRRRRQELRPLAHEVLVLERRLLCALVA